MLAAVEYLKTDPSIDSSRLGIMGWSFGGIASVLAASNSHGFFAVVDQAGGALTWDRSRPLQATLFNTIPCLSIPGKSSAPTSPGNTSRR